MMRQKFFKTDVKNKHFYRLCLENENIVFSIARELGKLLRRTSLFARLAKQRV